MMWKETIPYPKTPHCTFGCTKYPRKFVSEFAKLKISVHHTNTRLLFLVLRPPPPPPYCTSPPPHTPITATDLFLKSKAMSYVLDWSGISVRHTMVLSSLYLLKPFSHPLSGHIVSYRTIVLPSHTGEIISQCATLTDLWQIYAPYNCQESMETKKIKAKSSSIGIL